MVRTDSGMVMRLAHAIKEVDVYTDMIMFKEREDSYNTFFLEDESTKEYFLCCMLKAMVIRDAVLARDFDECPAIGSITAPRLAPKLFKRANKISFDSKKLNSGAYKKRTRAPEKDQTYEAEEFFNYAGQYDVGHLEGEILFGYVCTSTHWHGAAIDLPRDWIDLALLNNQEEIAEKLNSAAANDAEDLIREGIAPGFVLEAFDRFGDNEEHVRKHNKAACIDLLGPNGFSKDWIERHSKDLCEWFSNTQFSEDEGWTNGILYILENDLVCPFSQWYKLQKKDEMNEEVRTVVEAVLKAIDIVSRPMGNDGMSEYCPWAEIDTVTGRYSTFFTMGFGEMSSYNGAEASIASLNPSLQLAERMIDAGIIWLDRRFKFLKQYKPEEADVKNRLKGLYVYNERRQSFTERLS